MQVVSACDGGPEAGYAFGMGLGRHASMIAIHPPNWDFGLLRRALEDASFERRPLGPFQKGSADRAGFSHEDRPQSCGPRWPLQCLFGVNAP